MWIRIRIILAFRIMIQVSKKSVKSWETNIKIDQNYQNIIKLMQIYITGMRFTEQYMTKIGASVQGMMSHMYT